MPGARQAGLLALFVSLAATRADAQPDDAGLVWDVPERCGSRDAFVDRVGALLGRSAERAVPRDRVFLVRISSDADGYRLTVSEPRTIDPPRELEADDCESLVDAAAIVVALRIDPEALGRVEPAPEPRVVEPGPPEERVDALGAPAASVRAPHEQPAADTEPVVLGLTAGGGAALHLLPALAPGLAAGLFIERGPWRAELAGSWWLPQRASRQDRPEAQAEVELLAAVLRGCFTPLASAVHLDGCLAFEVGALAGHGAGVVVDPRRQVAAWLAGEAGLRGRIPLGDAFEVGLAVSTIVPFHRPTFVIEDAGTVYRPPQLGGRADVWFGFRIFP